MSFPRAKLQRFNENQTDTPSPADYNVLLRSHVAGAVIAKSGRFAEIPSPANSDNGSANSSISKPTFRTPNPPRRIKRQTSVDCKVNPVELFKTADDIEALKEKIVECNNKDLYIQEMTEQLEEMKQQLSNLESQIVHLNNDKLHLEENLEKLNINHENSLQGLQAHHQNHLGKMSERIVEVNGTMELIKKEYTRLKQENKKDLSEVLKNLATLEELYDVLTKSYVNLLEQKTKEVEIKEQQIKKLEEECGSLQRNHEQEMDRIRSSHQAAVQNIQYEMLRTVTEMQKQLEKEKQSHEKYLKEILAQKDAEFNNFKVQCDQEKLKLRDDSEAKIKQLTENYKETSVLAEMQMKEKCSDIEMSWKLKLEEAKEESDAILNECQAIAEYNIIQCEVEKNKALFDLSERDNSINLLETENKQIKVDCHNLENKCKLLQSELSSVIVELNSVREKMTAELQGSKISVDQLMKDKHTYEVTILKTHKTVETLKRRLMRSDQDVEQLKAELEATEESKLEFEGKCNQLTDELQIVCELCDDMEEHNEMALRIANEKVFKLEQQLLDKVENYKQQAKEEVTVISKELRKTKQELSDVLMHLHEQQKINIEAHGLISKSKEEMEQLDSANAKTAKIEQKYDELLTKYNDVVQKLIEKEDENAKLRKKVAEQESLIGPFREHLEAYELEYNSLMNEKQHAEREAKEMGLKYAEIIGHQNQKQKIKHLIDLKKKNYELFENKRELENKVRTQTRTIDKLKKELLVASKSPRKLQKAEDKENVNSPNRNLNSSHIDSPSGPLRDRN